jgi:acyl-CoA synthetase (NDP forming)
VVLGDDAPPSRPGQRGLPTFRSSEAALHAIAKAARYAAWRATPRPTTPVTAGPDTVEVRAAVKAMLEESRSHSGWLGAARVRELLGRYDADAPTGAVVTDVDEAVAAAERIGFPVAAKVADPDVLHKTDRKLVAVGLRSAAEVREAVASFALELGRDDVPVLVQPFVSGGVELALGVSRDPTFGPVVMVAAGGIATEVWKDRVFLVPPVTEQDAARAVKALRVAPLLEGFRGSEPCDVESFRDLVVGVARLAEDVPALAEMDLNPVIVTPKGSFCVDARIRLVEPASGDEGLPGVPRQLRSPG